MSSFAFIAWFALLAPVIGGSRANDGEFPDVVVVGGWTGVCTGTLVAPDVVLTAGHCSEIDPRLVVVGSIDYSVSDGSAIAIAQWHAYPDWQHGFDVAIAVLASPVGVTPRAIGDGCAISNGDVLRVAGFGLTDPSGSAASTELASAAVFVDDAACARDPACRAAIAPDGELVAGGSSATACFGDSGGPLLAPAAIGADVEIGVVSRATGELGKPCEGPTVYVRADAIAPWVEAVSGRSLARAPCAVLPPADSATDLDAASPGGGCTGCPGSGALPIALFVAWRRRMARRRA